MIKKETLIKVRSVKNSFRKELISTVGDVDITNRKPSKHEMSMAEVVVKEFGGDILFLKEKRKECVKMPDALWSGVRLEIKRAFGNISVDNSVRKAVKQISGEGVILLDVSKNRKDIEKLKAEAINRVERSGNNSSLVEIHIQIIFVKRKRIVDVLEITKRKT